MNEQQSLGIMENLIALRYSTDSEKKYMEKNMSEIKREQDDQKESIKFLREEMEKLKSSNNQERSELETKLREKDLMIQNLLKAILLALASLTIIILVRIPLSKFLKWDWTDSPLRSSQCSNRTESVPSPQRQRQPNDFKGIHRFPRDSSFSSD